MLSLLCGGVLFSFAKNVAKASTKDAIRAIESGVLPKVLQRLIDHFSIKTTIDRYVHVTDDSLTNAIKQFEQNTSLAS